MAWRQPNRTAPPDSGCEGRLCEVIFKDPDAELDPTFSGPDARPTPWPEAREQLAAAEIYWL